jgi:hypothetical protein
MGIVQERIKMDNEILKKVRREILKSAKKGEVHYYWDITGISESTIRFVVDELEKEGKMFKNKGSCKIIRW